MLAGGVETLSDGYIYLMTFHFDQNFASIYWRYKLKTQYISSAPGDDYIYISRMSYNSEYTFVICDSPVS